MRRRKRRRGKEKEATAREEEGWETGWERREMERWRVLEKSRRYGNPR